jgi:hypothetical protein
MRSDEDTKKFLGAAVAISGFPITMLTISRQPDAHSLITMPNVLNFLIGIISAGFCGMVVGKVIQQGSNSRSNRTFLLSVTIGASSGSALYAVLTEVVKRLQQ